jgi:hypothetical protein
MTTNRAFSIVRAPGRDAFQIQLFEYIDERPAINNNVLYGDIETRVLTEAGWQTVGELDDLPDNLPIISGYDLSLLPKKKRRKFGRFMRSLP